MGLLRLYMTLSIVAIHSGQNVFPWDVKNGLETLELFFLISGFYMAMIAGKYKSPAEFYASRGMRILIPYYAILLFVILLSAGTGLATGFWLSLDAYAKYSPERNGLLGVVLTALANLTVFFQDWVYFIQQNGGEALTLTAHFKQSPTPLYQYLLITPAWSIGIEIMFYLLVPLLARMKTRWLVLIAALSLAARVYAYQVLGLVDDPFMFRFFPFELLLFVAGMLMYRGYELWLMKRKEIAITKRWQYVLFGVAIIAVAYFLQWGAIKLRHPVGRPYAPLTSYIFWLPILPLAFHLTRNLKLDRFLGEITYSIYLIHFVVIQFLDVIFIRFALPGRYLGIASAALATGLSILLYLWIFEPFERRRGKLARTFADRWAGRPKHAGSA
jgi:peptidoglycan/LPS O-acetylase OafA/YrhL